MPSPFAPSSLRWTGAIVLSLALLPGTLFAQPSGSPEPEAVEPFDVLIVAPHPDDEAIGCAAVMIRALIDGRRVGVVLMTNGDGHVGAAAALAGKEPEQLEPADFVRLARVRQGHTVKALKTLGVPAENLIALGYPDSGLATLYETKTDEPWTQPRTGRSATYGPLIRDYRTLTHGRPAPYTRSAILEDLKEIIARRRPREIYVTAAVDTHGDHSAAFRFVRDAARTAGYRGELLTYVVHGAPPPGPPTRVILTAAELRRKRALLNAYGAGLSPVHDDLADDYMQPEERFWPVPVAGPAE